MRGRVHSAILWNAVYVVLLSKARADYPQSAVSQMRLLEDEQPYLFRHKLEACATSDLSNYNSTSGFRSHQFDEISVGVAHNC